MIQLLLLLCYVLLSSIGLSGCTMTKPQAGVNQNIAAATPVTISETVDIVDEGALKRVAVGSASVIETSSIPADLVPITFQLHKTLRSNADKSYLVWFIPGKGLVRWYGRDKSVKVFYEPTEWFYENPYFQFFGDTNTVVLIDKKGSEVVWVNLDTQTSTSKPVPYPFGTVFVISPDMKKIAYVEGYRQTVGVPAYLVTSIDGTTITQFQTKAEIANRSMVAWSGDSTGLLTVENGNQLVKYDITKTDQPTVVTTLGEKENIVDFETYGSSIYVTTQSTWYEYDAMTNQILQRLPMEAMAQLNAPRLIPYTKDKFLVEEEVKAFDQIYKRLWVSSWLGQRSMVLPQYGKKVSQVAPY